MRVVILSNNPEIVAMNATALRRLGHEPVAAFAARRAAPVAGLLNVDHDTVIDDVHVTVLEDLTSLASLLSPLDADLVLSWAFPRRVPPSALEVPSLGAINFHPSLLPRHRGVNPVAWTIRAGDADFGATWHRMESEYDCGPLLAQRSTPVNVDDWAHDVIPRLCTLGLRMLGPALRRVLEGERGDEQPAEGASDAGPFGEDYATIEWAGSARSVHDQVRAWSFTAGTGSVLGPLGEIDGQRVRVLRSALTAPEGEATRVECGDGPVWILASEVVS